MKRMNLLIEKRVMFMSLLLLLIFVSLVSGAIFFRYDDISPQVGGIDYSDSNSQPIVRKHEISAGTVMWSNGRKVKVYVLGHARGVGHGEGTLAPVTILGKTIPSHQDGSEEVGTKTKFGKWDYGNKTVWTYKAENIPIRSRETSFPWSAEGSIKLTPYGWQETVSSGGGFTIPLTITGTFSTSGKWITVDSKATTQHAASGSSGTHTVEVKYYCYSCRAEGDTKESIGGKDTHSRITCDIEGCTITSPYRKCDTAAAAKHEYCDGCYQYKCNGKLHRIIKCRTSHYDGSYLYYSCGKDYCVSACDASSHTRWSYCGSNNPHAYYHCVPDKHTLQTTCSETNENGNMCTVTNFYPCMDHTHQFTTSSGSDSSTDDDDDGTCGDETIWGTTYGTSGCGNPRNENSCTHPYIVAHYTIMWCEDCNQYYRKCSPPDYCSANHRNAYEIECLDATSNCDDCYDGRSDCTNASAH